jgi:hypothetical protein
MTRHILPSALRHGVTAASLCHAIDHAIVIADVDEDMVLYVGADPSGKHLEVITVPDDDDELIIHAMRLRPKDLPLLRGLG